ncbi:hypothetical protein M0R45_016226 [Rubus argutus]|uniref:Uncharacterized protein n=1 Tax=Rubus argutus TaxID=59490 RepID=A0AAW1XSG8_RUBAR
MRDLGSVSAGGKDTNYGSSRPLSSNSRREVSLRNPPDFKSALQLMMPEIWSDIRLGGKPSPASRKEVKPSKFDFEGALLDNANPALTLAPSLGNDSIFVR